MKRPVAIEECGIIGVGLIGGSLGLALRAHGIQVVGLDERTSTLQKALAMGAIDRAATGPAELDRADLAILCVSPAQIVPMAGEVIPFLKAGCLLTEVASVKAPIATAMRTVLKRSVRFVGMHPMCGTEGTGIESARADLFDGAPLVVTPSPESDPAAVQELEDLGRILKMRVLRLSPEEHDRQVAEVSHLPYLISVALAAIGADSECAGPAFRDATRVALSPSLLWKEIVSLNREPVLAAVGRLCRDLNRLSGLEGQKLEDALEAARAGRKAQGESRGWASGSSVEPVRVKTGSP